MFQRSSSLEASSVEEAQQAALQQQDHDLDIVAGAVHNIGIGYATAETSTPPPPWAVSD